MINTGLQAQYDYAVSQGLIKTQDVVLKKFGNQGFYSLLFGASRMIVDYSPGDLSSCIFRMFIQSGRLKVFSTNDPDSDAVTAYTLNKFCLACPVNIGLAGVPKDSEEYKRIRELMNKPGDYTIKQLFVDFASAQTRVLDPSSTDFGVWTASDWILKDMDTPMPLDDATPTKDYWRPSGWAEGQKRTITGDILENLKTCFAYALGSAMTKAAAGQLGFTATADAGNSEGEPTFVPSDVRFQTYPYHDSEGHTETGLSGKGQLNYLLYLEMTDNNTPPVGPDEFLPPDGGNWANGTDPNKDGIEEFGTYVLSRKNFVETWLLPKMRKLNRMMNVSYSGAEMKFWGNIEEWECKFRFPVLIGDGCRGYDVTDPRDDDYMLSNYSEVPSDVTEMIKQTGRKDLLPDRGSGAWCYYHWLDTTDLDQHDKDWNNECWSWAKAKCCSRLSVVPGKNTITLDGFSWLKFGFYVDGAWPIPNKDATNLVTVVWKVEFTMTEVTDGGLAVQISEPEVNTYWDSVATGWQRDGKDVDIKGEVNPVFDQGKKNFVNLTYELKNALQGTDKFYFPSRGRFFFKDALFGHSADLVVKCGYNGVETGDPNPDAPHHRDTSGPSGFEKLESVPFGGGGKGKKDGEFVAL
ncbi:hypothetical protein AJ80_05219 [Polytolypa hystricis UAMH7299]|uniref:Uncharacterized protein n=1 Tax=Polytolypa hystricis (strain UAMH7299) TaxID=1447883 RepID=A0A2B7Y5K1_POLH7|nr:hypothetical protein AJ80_05219 [Polytolypa hystricis UAMH7299]